MKYILTIFVLLLAVSAHAQTTEFTYQGSLNVGGLPGNGNFDFEFALFGAAAGGSQLGATQTRTNVPVANGVFSVDLDFGNEFPGADRFLEIRVRQSGGGAFTTLNPRQRVNSSPYSVKSLEAENASNADLATNATQLGGVPAAQYVVTTDPRMTDNRPPTAGSVNYIHNAPGPVQTANFNISGLATADRFNAVSRYLLNGFRVLSEPGQSNLFVGTGSGQNNSAGMNNTFVGASAGFNNTSGFGNAFFGASAGFANTASGNAFFGARAGQVNTTGGNNAFFGSDAGLLNTTGNFNSFFGARSGDANTTGGANSFFGADAGGANTTGGNNSFFGRLAGSSNTAGFSNAFFGMRAGESNTTGGLNTFVGAGAGSGNTTGSSNAFFGANAGFANTTGADNTFVGAGAGEANTTGGFNAFFGWRAGGSNTTGITNSFFGNATGIDNSTGNANSFFGWSAGFTNTTGGSNSFFGEHSGSNNTTGGSNSFFGVSAGTTNTTGSNNTMIGRGANVGSNNLTFATAIGANAVASMSNSIYLGRANGSDTVRIPGGLNVTGSSALSGTAILSGNVFLPNLGGGGSATLCRVSPTNLLSLCSSSARYKENINRYSSGVDLLKKLQPVSFDWKDGGMHDLGLVAEDVAAIEPLLTTYNDKGEIEGVKYDRIGVVLVNAIKEQQEEISGLRSVVSGQQNRIEAQAAEIKRQKADIEGLKALICSGNKEAPACRE